MTQNFDELIGQTFNLIKSNLINHFQLGKVLYEVLEDESDGYRSAMKHVAIVDDDADNGYYSENLGTVVVEKIKGTYKRTPNDNYPYEFDGYRLKDTETDHVWLLFGTDNCDDYYPSFTFDWTPKGA